MASRVLWIGDSRWPEFREAATWLREYCGLTVAATCVDACELIEQSEPPAVVIWAQPRSGQLLAADVERLQQVAPNARLIALQGSWCQGNPRASAAPPGVTAVLWHQFVPRVAAELTGTAEVPSPGKPDCESAPRGGLIAIQAANLESYRALADDCGALGYATVWVPREQRPFLTGAVAAIWDCRGGIAEEASGLRSFAEQLPGVPLLVVAGFPRADDCRLALACGATVVLAKPFQLGDLRAELLRIATAANDGRADPPVDD